jgi:hypothetical protein
VERELRALAVVAGPHDLIGVILSYMPVAKLDASDQRNDLAEKTAQWKNSEKKDLKLRRLGSVMLVLAGGTLVGWLVGFLGAPSTVWPHMTLDDLLKLGPVATALAAIVALIVGWITVRQKTNADRRDQWWKRTEFALGWAFGEDSDPARKRVGMSVLVYQGQSILAKRDERQFLLPRGQYSSSLQRSRQ